MLELFFYKYRFLFYHTSHHFFDIKSKNSKFFQNFLFFSCFNNLFIYFLYFLFFSKAPKPKIGLIYEINSLRESWSVVCIVHLWFVLDVSNFKLPFSLDTMMTDAFLCFFNIIFYYYS